MSGAEVAPNGVLPVLAMQAAHTNRRLNDAMDALGRIESALP